MSFAGDDRVLAAGSRHIDHPYVTHMLAKIGGQRVTARNARKSMQKKDHSGKSLRACQQGIERMSEVSSVLLTTEDGTLWSPTKLAAADRHMRGLSL
jgi:hypothetical protein